ncbi:MAG TPA: rod shape-determining protein MreD [Erythrobacter sp.]|nr:rod shape-determining protein MreD [Erythrobacter sp.]
MIEAGLAPRTKANPYRKRINREPSPLLATGVPYATIILASLLPLLFVADTGPLLPPLGFLMLIGWRLMRPGLLPSWAGLPLGAFDDLVSGQPFGSAILLWSIAMLAIEWLEARMPWRGFWQDWLVAAAAASAYVVVSGVVSGAKLNLALAGAVMPQIGLALVAIPALSGLIAWFDRLRLQRIRKVG